jgi:hypothetical protein
MTTTELSGEARVRRSPMERDALLFVIGQRFEDKLRGMKMLSWSHYERWAARREFFGDFDLVLGEARIRVRLFPQLRGHYLQAAPGPEVYIQIGQHDR